MKEQTEAKPETKTFLKITGETVHLKFGSIANRMFLTHLIEHIVRIQAEGYDYTDIAYLIYAGYSNACAVNDEKLLHKPGYFINYVEDRSLEPGAEEEFTKLAEMYKNSPYAANSIKNLTTAADEYLKQHHTESVN